MLILQRFSGAIKTSNITKKGFQAHHIIPTKLLKENAVVQDAVAAGFKFNGKGNGIAVKAFNKAKNTGQYANHPNYTNQVLSKINNWAIKNKDYTPEQAKSFIEGLSTNLKKQVQCGSVNGGKKVNDLIIK